jgi:hypothetical protein
MKTLIRFALGAAVAGTLVHALMNRRAGSVARATASLVADTNLVHGGDPAEEQRGQQPQDWRGAQNVLES